MLKVIITGPECSGKTSLAKKLSTFYQEPFIKEYARTYLEKNGSEYDYEDFNIIAKKQISLIIEREFKNDKLVISDTGLIVLYIWAMEVFNKCPDFILEALKEVDDKIIYILCTPDIPWEEDELRNTEDKRNGLFEKYQSALDKWDLRYIIVEGRMTTRLRASIETIRMLNS